MNTENPTNLARPFILIGGPPAPQEKIFEYVEKYGKEYAGAALPAGYDRGPHKECFANATLLVIMHDDLDYVEGIAYAADLGPLGFMHAWAVTKEGVVIDNTWDKPENCRYFGVKYDKAAYLEHIMTTEHYGVLGGDDRTALKVLKKGGL